MPGSSSNPALTADLGRNLRDRHPEIFCRKRTVPAVIPNRVAITTRPAPEIAPVGSLLGRLMAGALGLAFSPK